jgi:hypothetical protein
MVDMGELSPQVYIERLEVAIDYDVGEMGEAAATFFAEVEVVLPELLAQ